MESLCQVPAHSAEFTRLIIRLETRSFQKERAEYPTDAQLAEAKWRKAVSMLSVLLPADKRQAFIDACGRSMITRRLPAVGDLIAYSHHYAETFAPPNDSARNVIMANVIASAFLACCLERGRAPDSDQEDADLVVPRELLLAFSEAAPGAAAQLYPASIDVARLEWASTKSKDERSRCLSAVDLLVRSAPLRLEDPVSELGDLPPGTGQRFHALSHAVGSGWGQAGASFRAMDYTGLLEVSRLPVKPAWLKPLSPSGGRKRVNYVRDFLVHVQLHHGVKVREVCWPTI